MIENRNGLMVHFTERPAVGEDCTEAEVADGQLDWSRANRLCRSISKGVNACTVAAIDRSKRLQTYRMLIDYN